MSLLTEFLRTALAAISRIPTNCHTAVCVARFRATFACAISTSITEGDGNVLGITERRKPQIACEFFPLGLRERIGADVTETELVEAAVGQLMQSIHHVVMTAPKGVVHASRLKNGQLECAF